MVYEPSTNDTSVKLTYDQSPMLVNSDCVKGLHSYHNSKQLNSKGHPICKYCGADLIDWERIHRRDIEDVEYTISQLNTDIFRHEWWIKNIDLRARNHALRKGLVDLRQAAFTRLEKAVGIVKEMPDGIRRPYRDGFQTPFTGNSIYYAQHALACCCRKCMEYWHGVPYGRDLSIRELEYFVELTMIYLRDRLPQVRESGIYVPPIRQQQKT